MRIIYLIITFVIVISAAALYFLGVSVMDKTFWVDFFIGLLSNVLVLLLTAVVIEHFLKEIERKKLKDINKRKSENVSCAVSMFALKLINYLGLEKNYSIEYLPKALNRLVEMNEKKESFKTLYGQLLNSTDKKDYLKKLEALVKEGATSINNSLKDIYPHPAPDTVLMADAIYEVSGIILAMSVAVNIDKEVNKKILKEQEKMSVEMGEILLKFFVGHGVDDLFSRISSNLTSILERANQNSLFVE